MAATTKLARAKTVKLKNRPATPRLALGRVERVILYVSDFDRAVRWYTETLGLRLKHREDGWAALETQGTELDLHAGRESRPGPDEPQLGFHVADFDQALAALKSRGIAVGKVYSPCPGLRCASFQDPEGHRLGIEGE